MTVVRALVELESTVINIGSCAAPRRGSEVLPEGMLGQLGPRMRGSSERYSTRLPASELQMQPECVVELDDQVGG